MTCIRCRGAEAAEPLGLCPACTIAVRVELSGGFKLLGSYLANWAAFESWLADRGRV